MLFDYNMKKIKLNLLNYLYLFLIIKKLHLFINIFSKKNLTFKINLLSKF